MKSWLVIPTKVQLLHIGVKVYIELHSNSRLKKNVNANSYNFWPLCVLLWSTLNICSVGRWCYLYVSYVATCASNPTYGVATYLQLYLENINLIILAEIIPLFFHLRYFSTSAKLKYDKQKSISNWRPNCKVRWQLIPMSNVNY